MSLINIWPENQSEAFDNKQWKQNEWPIGSPLTREKLENLESGIAILATQMSAIMKEIGAETFDDLILNKTRIDKLVALVLGKNEDGAKPTDLSPTRIDDLEAEIGGTRDSSNGGYNNSRIDVLEERATAIENVNATQDKKLDIIFDEIGGIGYNEESDTYDGTTRIDTLINEVWGSDDTDGDSRLDINDRFVQAVKNELGGTYVENEGFTDSKLDVATSNIAALQAKATALATNLWGEDITTGNSRLDNLINEIYDNTDAVSRLDKLDNKIAAINNEIGGAALTGDDMSYDGTTRLDDIEKELGGERVEGEGYNGSRLDIIEAAIQAIKNEFGGTYIENDGFTNSRLDALEAELLGTGADYENSRLDRHDAAISALEERATTLETDNTTNKTNIETSQHDISNIINEIGGTYSTNNGFSNSYINSLLTDVEAIKSKNQDQDWALAAIKNEIGGEFVSEEGFTDSRIDVLETNTTELQSTVRSHTSRITSAENRITRLENEGGSGGGGGTASIAMERTINTAPSDALVLSSDTILYNNGITLIMLNEAMLGTEDATIRIDGNDELVYDVYITEDKKLRAPYPKGSLLGLYLGNSTTAYIFNAPLVL